MDSQTSDIARSYDEVPYTSRPFPQSQPQRLAALGRLFGLTPPDVATARVLELGCAAGGNLIPLATAFPDAHFIGVDLSGFQVAEGQARIARLGLKNIRLVNMSIADITAGFGAFDYVICHGVYSWVPAAVRDAILRISHDNLTDHGIAYISYNVFPGWRLRSVLREAMMFHGSAAQVPSEKIRLGREFLAQLSSVTNAGSAYGQMLRQEAQNLRLQEDYYVTHEYLETNNEPCYFSEFHKRMGLFNLAYLTECDLHLSIAETFGAETGQLLRELSGNRLDRMEQYIDFLTGRTFRQTLLIRADQASRINRVLGPSGLAGLHISSSIGPEPERNGDNFIFKDAAGRTLTTASLVVRDAVMRLARMYPLTAPVEMLAANQTGPTPSNPADAADITRSLFNLLLAGLASVSTVPVIANAKISDLPKATSLARADASDGKDWTTNVRHEPVPLTLVARAVLPLLDGTRSRDDIKHSVHAMVQQGKIKFERNGAALEEPDHIAEAIEAHVSTALSGFQRTALLMP